MSSSKVTPSPLLTTTSQSTSTSSSAKSSSRSHLTKGSSSSSKSSSSRRKEVQFSPQSSLPVLGEDESYIKRRPRSHSNPTTAKTAESFYPIAGKLRRGDGEIISSYSKHRSNRNAQQPSTEATLSLSQSSKTGSESSLRKSSSLRSCCSIKSSSSISSVKSYPTVKHSRSVALAPKAESSSKVVRGTSLKEKEPETQESNSKNNKKASLATHLKAFSSGIIMNRSASLVEPEAGSKKYMPIESTPPVGKLQSCSSESRNFLSTSNSKDKLEHSSISKCTNEVFSNGTFSPPGTTSHYNQETKSSKSSIGSKDKRESELRKHGGANVYSDERVKGGTTKKKEEKTAPVMNGTYHVTTQQPSSSSYCSNGSSAGRGNRASGVKVGGAATTTDWSVGSAQLTTEEQQPLLLPANKIVSTGVCRWFRCCPVTSPSMNDDSSHRRSVAMQPDI